MVEQNNPTPTPGQAILSEIAKRGWTHDDLAIALGKHRPMVTSLISGKRSVTPELAVALAAAIGHSPEYWLALESARQLSLIPESAADVVARAKLLDFAPVKDMERRGWIKPTSTAAELELELKRFFNVSTLDVEPPVVFAARKANPELPHDRSQRAWCARAKQLASAMVCNHFDPGRSEQLIGKLRRLAAFPKEAAHVCDTLMAFGVRMVVVEPFEKSRIDGAAFWVSEGCPAIALSMRIDRIDGFWFTVMHEVMHIVHGDLASIDSDLAGKDSIPSRMKVEIERKADEAAAAALVSPSALAEFVSMFSPLYSKVRINQFAQKIKMHPGIIVGQLQHRGELSWNSHRDALIHIRDVVTTTTLTDGWGKTISPDIIN